MRSRRGRRLAARLRSWMALTLREKGEFLLVAAMAVLAEIAVKVFSLPRLTRSLGIALVDKGEAVVPTAQLRPHLDAMTIENRARMVDRLYRAWPRKNSCLRRALVLGYRIRAARPVLEIGVAREEGSIRAHAWIEVDGRVVGDDSGDYAPLRSHKTAG